MKSREGGRDGDRDLEKDKLRDRDSHRVGEGRIVMGDHGRGDSPCQIVDQDGTQANLMSEWSTGCVGTIRAG